MYYKTYCFTSSNFVGNNNQLFSKQYEDIQILSAVSPYRMLKYQRRVCTGHHREMAFFG